MQALELPPEIEDALLSLHWKAATYPDSLPSLPFADLHRTHDPGGAAEWIGIARTDWAITRVSNPTGEGLSANCGELRPGVGVEFVCRSQASVTARPLYSDDVDLLEDLAVGDELPSDISVNCLSLSGVLADDSCEDKILAGSRFLGKIKDRYTFEYEPLQRLRRNFGEVSEVSPANAAFDVYQLREDGPPTGYVVGQSDDGVEGLDLYRRCNLHLAAVVIRSSPLRHSVRSTTSLRRSISMTSRREVAAAQDDQKWRVVWSPPKSFVVMPGDFCVVGRPCAHEDVAEQLADLFSGRATVRMDRQEVRASSRHASPLLSWMVALVLPNPTSDKITRKTVSEEEAKTIFKRSFKPVVAGQNRAEYLGQRRQKFLREFRELPSNSTQSKSFLDLAFGRTQMSGGGKQYGAPGKPSRLPQIPSLARRSSRCERQPRCFLELLQRNIIEELVEDCGLSVEPCFSEDKEKIILLITCSKEMLMREAEFQRYNMELDLQAVDPESLEPCSSDFEPLLYRFIGDIQRQSDLQKPIGPEATALLERYQEVVETIETEWADATAEFRKRFGRARAFWLAGGMHASSMYWDASEPAGNLFGWCKRSSQRRAAFMEYMSLRAQWGLRPHSRILMREASHHVRRQRCGRLMKFLRLWSPMVETWNRVLQNHWDRFAGGMKHGRAMAFCGKRPGMEWAAFRTFETQTLKKNGEDGGSIDIPFCSKDCLLLVVSMLHRGLFIEELLHEGTMLDYIALDSSDKEEALGRIWQVPENASFLRKAVWFARGLLEPPMTDEINHYYSSRIAFYFELTKFLITQLFPLGVLGLMLQVLRAFDRDHVGITASDTVFFIYAVVTPFWVIFVLSLWRRRQAWLVTHWGRSAHAVLTVRPAFWGLHRRSPTAVGEFEITFPQFYHAGILGRFPRQVVSYIVLLMLVSVEFACAIPITMIRRDLDHNIFRLALPALIQVFGLVGYVVARRLNEWENYPTSSAFIGNLAFKISCFEFLNRYGILFYIAFLKAFWEGCIVTNTKFRRACGFDRGDCQMCKEELEEYVALVLVSSVAVSSTQLVLPLVWNLSFGQVFALLWWRGRRQEAPVSGPVDSSARMAQVVQQVMDRQEFGDTEVDGSFDDYLQVFVLFGYAALFSVAFPAAPLVVAFAMMVELRVDGVKIYNLLRRPFPIPANGLESWMHILHALVVCAVAANAGLAVWTFRLLGGDDDSGRWIRFLIVMVSTTVLITITQLAPCFNTDESSLPMQVRTNYIVDNLIDSSAVGGSRKSFIRKSFYSSKGDVASSSCSDSGASAPDGEGGICNDDVVVRLNTSESLDLGSEPPSVVPQGKSVRFSGRQSSRLFSPRHSQPLLEFRLMPCFSAALRCFYPNPEERSCERGGA